MPWVPVMRHVPCSFLEHYDTTSASLGTDTALAPPTLLPGFTSIKMVDARMPCMYTSVYVHIPFCRHRCAYCDFNTYAGLDDLIPDYVRALVEEIGGVGRAAARSNQSRSVHTVFFGGGTPSLLSGRQLEAILGQVRASFKLAESAEITLEANPGTLDLDGLITLRRVGINRLSLGMQSSHADELRMLERQHGLEEIQQAVAWARQAGIDNLNLDLIYGLPNQSLARWEESLNAALAMAPDHLSLYALSLEFGTPMHNWVARGRLPSPDPDLAADMYELAGDRLTRAGYVQYEISNWARPGSEGQPMACEHNLQIWRNRPYLGFGAGAHGCTAGWRTRCVRSPRSYIKRLVERDWNMAYPSTPATAWRERQTRARQAEDTMILGLRLTIEGVSDRGYQKTFGHAIEDDFGDALETLVDDGLLQRGDGRWRLTSRGRLLGNRVFERFIRNDAR
jgi:oxygen-independent coproporphyrinogen-3 oxidase